MSAAGVYYIECTPTGRFYIGSSISSLRRRFNQHRYALRSGRSEARKLQRAWDKYGEEAFVFSPLLFCAPDQARLAEQLAIDLLRPEFNSAPAVGALTFRPATNDEMRAAASVRAKAAWAAGKFTRNGKTERNFYVVHGERLSVAGIVAKYGLSKQTVEARIRRGYQGDAIALPLHGRGQAA